jgi:hypothetical protein
MVGYEAGPINGFIGLEVGWLDGHEPVGESMNDQTQR